MESIMKNITTTTTNIRHDNAMDIVITSINRRRKLRQHPIHEIQVSEDGSSHAYLSLDCLEEYPTIPNGLSSTTDDNTAQAHEPTVSKIPIIWGPSKRNK